MKKGFTFKAISVYLIAALFVIGMVPRVEAGFIPSHEAAQGSRAADMENIQRALETKIVTQTLNKMGYTNDEIQSRLAGMTDQQLHKMAGQIDNARAAGDGLEVIIVALFIIIIVLAILHVTGHRVIVR